MKVWIDLANSPHALLFAPISRRLEELGHTVFVTARDNAQTVELGRTYWPELVIVGGESPGGRSAKARAIGHRVGALRKIARQERPDVALSHNSYAQIAAAKLVGLRAVTAMDYEFQPANHLAFRLADRVLLPEVLRTSRVRRQGASNRKTLYYPGFKEELYLGDFEPDPEILNKAGVRRRTAPLVVVRTPPEGALYHQFENSLFGDVMRHLGRSEEAEVVVLPRTEKQARALRHLARPNLQVLDRAVDSRSLLINADAFVGAGGTMTREAALLGVRAHSLFAGRRAAVDLELERQGRLRFVTSRDDVDLSHERESCGSDHLASLRQRGSDLVEQFVAASLETTIRRRMRSNGR